MAEALTRPKDDPAWVLARYGEAKEILDDLNAYGHMYRLPDDLRETILAWHNATLLDGCTTCGVDCACNGTAAAAGAAEPEPVYRFRTLRKNINFAAAQQVCAREKAKRSGRDIRIVQLDGAAQWNAYRVLELRGPDADG